MPVFLAPIVAWFTSSVGKLALWAIGIGAVVTIASATYFSFVHQIENRVKAEEQAKRLEQVVKDQEVTIANQKKLMQLQLDTTTKLEGEISTLNQKGQSVQDWLATPEVQSKNRPASDILKETLKRLGDDK